MPTIKPEPEKPERRSLLPVDTELRVSREEGKPVVIEGYNIIYGKWANIGWFDERISVGAATEAIKKGMVPGLIDHKSELIVGRTGVNITVTEDDKGVFLSITEPSAKSARFDQLASDVESGLITGQSFAFRSNYRKEEWTFITVDEGKDVREQREIVEIAEIFDYSFVTYPAYDDTTVAKRSLEIFKAAEEGDTDIGPELRANDRRVEAVELKLMERNIS